jgi:2,2-dialkylglycine decarboxylase (pyruvate)
MKKQRNLELWNAHGKHLIPVQPFMDNVIVRSEGNYMIDADGNRLLDLAAGQFCTILGHNHPGFIKRLTAELQNNLHTGSQYMTETVLRAASEVAGVTPEGLDSMIFLSTGSEANEFAVRVAKTYTGRTGVLGSDRGYYGITLATRSLSAIAEGHVDASPRVPGSACFFAPVEGHCPVRKECKKCDHACLDASFRLLGDQVEGLAAIIVETIVSAGGMLYPSPEYFARLRQLADETGALLIVDEAQTGFGRCGAWWDHQNLNLKPDILVFSKTSGNGYPTAGVVISRKITERLLDKGFHHLSSHQNDPIAAASVSAVIATIKEENLIENAKAMGDYFLTRLREMEGTKPFISGSRGRGLMLAFDLLADRESGTPLGDRLVPFVLACKERGVHITFSYHEGAVRVIPSITLTRAEIDFAIDVIGGVLVDLEAGKLRAEDYEQQNHVIRDAHNRSKVRRTLARMWETSPSYWARKARR